MVSVALYDEFGSVLSLSIVYVCMYNVYMCICKYTLNANIYDVCKYIHAHKMAYGLPLIPYILGRIHN